MKHLYVRNQIEIHFLVGSNNLRGMGRTYADLCSRPVGRWGNGLVGRGQRIGVRP